jgi:hypothetical protein
MARSRNIKPGFFMNEVLSDLPFETRLLFIGLWTLADREGRFEDRPRRVRIQLFPLDEGLNIDQMMQDLAGRGFLVRYQSSDINYCQIVNFTKHQSPHHKEVSSDIPAPDGLPDVTRHGYDVSKELRAKIFERDGSACLKCSATGSLSIDHIVPLSKGGDNTEGNLQTLCHRCNSAKGDSTKSYIKGSDVAFTARSNYKQDSTLNQCKSNVDGPCPPDSLIPDSLFSDSLIPASLIPDSETLPSAVASAPSNVQVLKPKQKPKTDAQQANANTWDAYTIAYLERYGVEPVRNAKVNTQIAQLVQRLGADEAPQVAMFYVTINDSFFIRASHELGLLVSRAEGIRTQWLTGRQVNAVTARQMENTQANINAAQQAAQSIRNGGQRNAFL